MRIVVILLAVLILSGMVGATVRSIRKDEPVPPVDQYTYCQSHGGDPACRM